MNNGAVNTLQVQITAEANVDINNTVTASVSSSTADPNMNNNSLKRSGSGCFIATAAYGHIDHQYVQVLRNFRDDHLLTNEPGQAFVETYYAHSPALADWLAEREGAKAVVRVLLLPLIALAWLIQAPLVIQVIAVLMLGSLVWFWKQGAIGALLKKGMAGAGLLLALFAGNAAAADQIYYVHGDHLNVPNVVTNQDRQVVWEGHRKPFGETDVSVASIRQPFRFPGQYYDQETGLHYNLMRDYDPRLGRYVQSDPIGLGGGVNTYGYAGQYPVLNYDPNGQLFISALPLPWITGGGISIGGASARRLSAFFLSCYSIGFFPG